MGRPYSAEMNALPRTYAWASRLPIGGLAGFAGRAAKAPMYAVGSGGSFTSATFAAALHQQGGSMSQCVSPLDFVWHRNLDKSASAMILTAGGNNKDILASFDKASSSGLEAGIVCTSTANRLIRRASGRAFVYAARPPCGKDGFLATNSLIATMVWLSRAYSEALSLAYELPRFGRLAPPADAAFAKIRKAKTLVVLHDDWGKSAAVDAESKMSEAGLVSVQISDYRSFAHGRHNWLDKVGGACVVALVTPQCCKLAGRTAGLIPGHVPVLRLETSFDGPVAALDLTLQVFRLVGFFGRLRGTDPGRPGVADFGRKLYGLGTPIGRGGLADLEALALRRKFGSADGPESAVRARRKALDRFVYKMTKQEFGAAIFDYDGTLCDEERKETGPTAGIGSMISGLVRRGVAVGVATGRGDSVRDQLRRLLPGKHHASVMVGYHNGAEIGDLSDSGVPDPRAPADESLHSVLKALRRDRFLGDGASVGPMQVSLRSPHVDPFETQRRVDKLQKGKIRVVESGHSVDLLAPGVSKLALFRRLAGQMPAGRKILCFGDRGRRPGNDHELLGTEYSLSVDEASEDPSRCWNLLPAGVRGEAGVLHYMKWFAIHDGFAKLERLPFASGGRTR